ncbi:hypothetical protein TBS_13450 [Thermobispora bispora]|uniref:hypothetical protein n=1 Tax=Thermobispora bispora TaxID=2006 RepID=UPI0030E8BCD4
MAPAVNLALGAVPAGMGMPAAAQQGPLLPPQVRCAEALRHLYGWLRASLPQWPQVAGVIPSLVQGVRLYRNGQYEACLAHIQSVLGAINAGQTAPLR